MPQTTRARIRERESLEREEQEARPELQKEEEEYIAFQRKVGIVAEKAAEPLQSFAILLIGFLEDELKLRNELNQFKKNWHGTPLNWERSSIMVCMDQLKGLMRVLEAASQSKT